VDKIRTDLGETGRSGVAWIGLAQDMDKWRAIVNAVMNLRVPYNTGKLSSDVTTGGLSSSVQLDRIEVGCLHLVACTSSGSGFPSNATQF
jgi:hypothetical protein